MSCQFFNSLVMAILRMGDDDEYYGMTDDDVNDKTIMMVTVM